MNLNRLYLYINTVKHLRFKQFIFNIIRRLPSEQKFIDVADVTCTQLSLTTPVHYHNKITKETVCFLNECRDYDYISSWACLDEPKLWRYNLHYFDYLLDDGASLYIKDKLIDDWINISLSLKVDAWEPYTTSLRIVNWIKYFVTYKNNKIPQHWLESLYQQSRMLFNLVEYHILANHLLKNGKALLFAGAYLNCDESKKWFVIGKRIVLEELGEQIMSDGGHYEKSPMYHSIVVEDYLDIINLIKSNALDVTNEDISYLKEKTGSALNFLCSILMPDGNIPLFNDSAFNIAPHPDVLFAYATKVMGYKKPGETGLQSLVTHIDSGYYIIKDEQNMCIIDCGAASPTYQPGHTHCDLLSYELSVSGRRVIVDSGVYDYEDSDIRRYIRSTRAHNTVMVDDTEQFEIWGAFRVARRAQPLSASFINNKNDNTIVFEGSHDGYMRLSGKVVHHRKLSYCDSKSWKIEDSITGEGMHKTTSYVHIHPDYETSRDGSILNINDKNGEMILRIVVSSSADSIKLLKGWYCPEFGKKFANTVITIQKEGSLPHSLSYEIFRP